MDGHVQARTRREAIRLGCFATLGLAAGSGRSPAGGEAPRRSPTTKPIPSTGERLPVVGLGTGGSFSRAAADPSQHDRLRATLRRFHELGGAVVDTAPNYGRAERVLGRLLGELGLRRGIFLATKVADVRGREAASGQARESASRAGPGPIDLLQVHNLVDWRNHVPLLLELKARGLVRYVGVTTYRDDQYGELETVMRTHRLDFVQVDYAIDNRGVEARILPLAGDAGVAVIANMPFGAGRLLERVGERELPPWVPEFGAERWPQLLLRWIVSHPHVTVTIPSTSRPEHVEDNVRSSFDGLPSVRERARLTDLFEGWIDA